MARKSSVFAEAFFAALGIGIALFNSVVGFAIRILGVCVWMLLLQISLYAQQSSAESQWKSFHELEEPNLGDLLPAPTISLDPVYAEIDSVPSELRQGQEYEFVKETFKTWKGVQGDEQTPDVAGRPGQAYLSTVEYLGSRSINPLEEWMQFFKADLLFARQLELEQARLSLALEEYQLAIRLFPLSQQVPRALYQVALIQLESGLYEEARQTSLRAMNDFPSNDLMPQYLSVNAEQYFRRGNFDAALERFSQVVRRFPRSEMAIDAAFRRAFLLFKQNRFQAAMETYAGLEKFHKGAMQLLKMQRGANRSDWFMDRVFYAETLFLTKKYDEASNVFQSIGNLFPDHPAVGLIWIRYADTFFFRNRYDAALRLYAFVETNTTKDSRAVALSRIRTADTLIFDQPLQAQRRNEGLYSSAYSLSKDAGDHEMASLALAKLARFHLSRSSLPKAKAVLAQLKSEFPDERNQVWTRRTYAQLVEAEILDHYRANDYLAALTEYLAHERDESTQLTDVKVLLRLADAAIELGLFDKGSDILNRVIYLESSAELRQEALLRLIQILIDQGELRKASERLRRFNFAYPRTNLAFLYEKLWGELYSKLGRVDRAIENFERSVSLASRNRSNLYSVREVFMKLGHLYTISNLPLKAIESYERFTDLYKKEEEIKLGSIPFTPQDAYLIRLSRYRIADIHFNSRDFVQALRSYREVIQGESEPLFRTHAQFRIGESYLHLSDRDAAIEAFKKVESPDPQNIWVRAAQSYIETVKMEVENEIRIFN